MSGYIGTQPVPQATQTRDAFTATNNQTSFPTSGYTPEFLDVFLNGVKLAASDYTATNGSDVVLAVGATTSDILEVVAYSTFEVLNPTFDGNVTFTGNASFGDNDKAIFGDGSDLQIYHNGGDSLIADTGAGDLYIRGSNNIFLQKGDGSETFIATADNGAVTLYHDNAAKLATTSTGIDVTGTATSTALTTTNSGVTLQSSSVTKSAINVAASTNQGINGTAAGDQYNWTTGGKMLWSTNSGTNAHLVLDSSGNVGIGTTTVGEKLHVKGTGRFENSHSTPVSVHVNSGNNDYGQIFASTTSAWKNLVLNQYGGNVLVGKATTAFGTAGANITSAGSAEFTRDSVVMNLNRLSTDGDIQRFYKDGTTVGAIGSSNTGERLYMANDSTGLSFIGDFSNIFPCDSGGTARDNAINLGGVGGRFKDLYLSGGIYLGGTGSANKLDDYEEGTFTPTITGSSSAGTMIYSDRAGRYQKVGRLVTIHFYIQGNNGTGSGNLLVGGLPFTSANYHLGYGSPQWNNGIAYPSGAVDANFTRFNSTSFEIRCNKSSAVWASVQYPVSPDYLRGCITYETTE